MKSRSAALLIVLAASALAGCAGSTTAVFDSLKYAVQRNSDLASVKLNPDFRYLRASIQGRTVLLVLGYVDQHPLGPVEVWYSAEREVLRLQNGRIVGATGLTTEWRNVQLSDSPRWASILAAAFHSIKRVRDIMPGYSYGVEDTLVARPSSPPARSSLIDVDPSSLAWFEETIARTHRTGRPGPAFDSDAVSRFAVRIDGTQETVVYGEQCLSKEVCFAWQRWPVESLAGQSRSK